MVAVLRVPLTITNGRFGALEQDSDEEVSQACWVLLSNRAAAPDLDPHDPAFSAEPDTAAAGAEAVLAEYEPRVDADARAEIAADYVMTVAVDTEGI